MESKMLRKAREYERFNRERVRDTLPAFHVTGGIGWINDPNGFSLYKGEYHLFFQYYPYDVSWGPMHWGHVKTKDFIRWEYLPAALAPDAEYDKDGCFSGSAVELSDGDHLLLYTGVRKTDDGDEYQTQCIAVGDGVDYQKSPLNPVIDSSMLPDGGSHVDFRDPKIWRDGDGFHTVAANLCPDGSGAILQYDSDDGQHWRYAGVLAAGRGHYGTMWECPDFFTLNGKAVLLHSAHEMQNEGLEYHPGDGTVCHIGQFDPEKRCLLDEHVQTIDYGLDFYAPQTVETSDGRRIMIGWMQSWAGSREGRPHLPFFGQMTVPRELSIRDGRLYQKPVRELEACRRNVVRYENVTVTDWLCLPGVAGRMLDMQLRIRGTYGSFRIRVAEGEGVYTELTILPEAGIMRMDRLNSGFPHDIVHVREFPAPVQKGELDLRIIMDKYSLELFAGGGACAASMTLYTPLSAEGIRFSADGAALLDVEKYDISVND
jgi:beta-fructofuranosidase